MPGLLSRLVNLRTSAMAAAGRSRLACSLPRAGAAAAAAAPSVYTPAGHIAAWRRRVSRCSSLPPSAAPPSFPPSLPRSLAVRPHGGGRSLPQRARAPCASSPRRRVCLARKGVWRGREHWRGNEGHEGRGGKWQPLGLRPQLILLVQPPPGGEVWLLHFRLCVFWGGEGGTTRNVSKCAARSTPALLSRPGGCSARRRTGELSRPATPQAPGTGAARGCATTWSSRLLCAPPGRGRADVAVEGGRAGFPAGATRLGPLLPTPFSYPSILLTWEGSGGNPRRERASGTGNLLWASPPLHPQQGRGELDGGP